MALQGQPSAHSPAEPLPPEIWIHVARFVPDADLRSMLSINRIFFELSMDARYHTLTFGANSNPEALWKLQRAKDPPIAHRVRHLYLNLHGDTFHYQFNKEGELNPGWTGISLLDGIQIMARTVTCLTYITELSVEWGHFPPGEHLVPLLTLAWKSFGHGLRKLSFRVSLKYLAPLLSTADGLVALRDLDVKVDGPEFVETHGEALSTALAPFVNKVAPTLHSLSYYSTVNCLDSSPFFHHLERIPNLEQLCVFVYNYRSIIAEPFSATRFLCNHATTLRHLNWDEGPVLPDTQYLMDLQSGNNLKEVFSNLCTLLIRVPRSLDGFSIVVQHLKGSAETLTSLELLECSMTYEELNTLVALFTPHRGENLKELDISVEFLSPEVILLIAQTLPCLAKLALEAMHLTGHEAGKRTSNAILADDDENREREERMNSGIFANTLKTYDIRSWRLRDIHIWISLRCDPDLGDKIMLLLAECVPAVQTLDGRDKELYTWIDPDDRL